MTPGRSWLLIMSLGVIVSLVAWLLCLLDEWASARWGEKVIDRTPVLDAEEGPYLEGWKHP